MKEIVVTLPQFAVVVLLLVFLLEIVRAIVLSMVKTKKPIVQTIKTSGPLPWSKLGVPLENLDERKIKR